MVTAGCPCRERCLNVELWTRGGGVCSCMGCVLVELHGDTGVEGGVNGLNPTEVFLS